MRYMWATVSSIMSCTALAAIAAAELANLGLVERQLGVEVALEDLGGGIGVGPLDLDLHVEAARAQDGRVDEVLAVRCADDDDVAQGLHAVDLGEQLGHDGRLHVGADASAARAEQRVHLVEEDDDRHALFGLLAGALEDHADLALGLADVLVQQLGTFDVEEVGTHVAVPGELGDLLGSEFATALAMRVLPQPGGP